MNNSSPVMNLLYSERISAGFKCPTFAPFEMSNPSSKLRAWEARVGLGDDERRDLQRIEVLSEVMSGRRTVAACFCGTKLVADTS